MHRDQALVKLNYLISEEAESRLSDYCSQTGRSASDVVRQLVFEYLLGGRTVGNGDQPRPLTGRRTNCLLPQGCIDGLDERAREAGVWATKGAIISKLLEGFRPGGHDNAVVFHALERLVVACEERWASPQLYQEALAAAKDIVGRGQKDGR